jgi:hypothetical protein
MYGTYRNTLKIQTIFAFYNRKRLSVIRGIMIRSIILWALAVLITIGAGIYQRRTGPTYPLDGKINFGGKAIPYHFERTHAGPTNYPLSITTKDSGIIGTLEWRYYKGAEEWMELPMKYSNGTISAELPNQPPAGKLEYRIYVRNDTVSAYLPENRPVVVRFRGEVPLIVLVLHILAMFAGMLISTRAGLEVIAGDKNLMQYAKWTIIFLFIGGFIFGPLMQWYSFGNLWTGWPFGNDVTDNKTVIAILGWLFTVFALKKFKYPRRIVFSAAILTLIVYLIPHSVLGSELDYSKQKQEIPFFMIEGNKKNP